MSHPIDYKGIRISFEPSKQRNGYLQYIDKKDPSGILQKSFTVEVLPERTFIGVLKEHTWEQKGIAYNEYVSLFKVIAESAPIADAIIIGFKMYYSLEKDINGINVNKFGLIGKNQEYTVDGIRVLLPYKPPVVEQDLKHHDKKPHHFKHATSKNTKPVITEENIGNVGKPVYEDLTEAKPASNELLGGLVDKFNKQ